MSNPQQFEEKKLSAEEKANARLDLRAELDTLERMIYQLKTEYEQYFMAIVPMMPEKLHKQVKMQIRKLMNAPFKTSAVNYKLRMLENRYQTYNTYWERVLKQREEGTYHKDLFRADLRERIAAEEAFAQTQEGKASRAMVELFKTYKKELEKQSGKAQNLDFKAFRKTLLTRAKQIKDKHGVKKVSFEVKVKDGKITVQAKGR